MMNRRQALVAIGVAAFGAEHSNSAAPDLRADLARIRSRPYSEEGVPMFLACKNLVRSATAPEPSPAPLNRKVASAFHRYAEEWLHTQPDAPVGDVAKILELLAERDFSDGGAEVSL